MLATNTHIVPAPSRRQPALASASEISDKPTSSDLDLLKQLMESKVLDRLKGMLQLAHAGASANDRAIRLPEVLRMLPISKSTWYDRLNPRSPAYDPLAPQPFKLGSSERSPSVWWYSEIIAYLEAHAAASRNR